MYKVGQKVMYLSKKMMIISAIEDKSFQENCIKKYYLLKSEKDDNNVIYLPVDSDIANKNIRPLLTKKEINKCIDSFNDIDSVYESSYKDRVLKYNELIKNGDVKEMLSVIDMLLIKKEELAKEKKTLSNIDLNCLKELMNAIEEEFSEVLDIKKEEVAMYIEKRLIKLKR